MGNKFQIVWRLLVVVFLALLPMSPVLASDTAGVTINMRFSGGILSFVVTYVSNTEADFTWQLDPSTTATNIMIRGEYNRYPSDIPNDTTAPSDGYLVYYGDGIGVTTAIDNSLNQSDNLATLYYKAWAQKADGTWFTITTTSSRESVIMLFIAFVVIALGLTIAAFMAKTTASGMLRIASVVAWLIMIPLAFGQNWPSSNTYLPAASALFCAAMMLIMVVATVTYYIDWRNTRRTHEPTDEEYQASYARQVRGITKKKSKWD